MAAAGARCRPARIFVTRYGRDKSGNGRDVSKNCGQQCENTVNEMHFSSPFYPSFCYVKNQNKRNNLALARRVDFEKYSAHICLNKNCLWRKKAENIFVKVMTIKSMISIHGPNKNIYFSNVFLLNKINWSWDTNRWKIKFSTRTDLNINDRYNFPIELQFIIKPFSS